MQLSIGMVVEISNCAADIRSAGPGAMMVAAPFSCPNHSRLCRSYNREDQRKGSSEVAR